MGFHHVAIATRDPEATHRFYTDVMGFELVKTEAAPAPEGGWARHLFYDTGDGSCLAFWDVHDDPAIDEGFDPSISRGLGLPTWTNHLAFDALRIGLALRKRQVDVKKAAQIRDPAPSVGEFGCALRHDFQKAHALSQIVRRVRAGA